MADEELSISFEGGTPTVDTRLVADGLKLRADVVPSMIRAGSITCRFERGMDEDDGRFRLTFWHGSMRFRIVVDSSGRVLKRLRLDYGGSRQMRPTKRKRGPASPP